MMEQTIAHGLGQTGFSVRYVDAIGRRSVLSFTLDAWFRVTVKIPIFGWPV